MLKSVCFIFIICIALVSCSQVRHIRTNDITTVYEETNPSNVEVYAELKIEKKYDVIGEVIVTRENSRSSQEAVSMLKKEAAKIGADAVIGLRLTICAGGFWYGDGVKAFGTAIKYNK
jgi:uncharacterized protein YbjQ (UPF0145 family)